LPCCDEEDQQNLGKLYSLLIGLNIIRCDKMNIFETNSTKKFLYQIGKTKNAIIMDFGCGGGTRFLNVLARNDFSRGIGIDISINHLKDAKKLAYSKQLAHKVDFVLGDVHYLPFRNNIFDFVIIVNILYILTGLKSLSGMVPTLKDGACLLIAEKTFNPILARALATFINQESIKRIVDVSGCSFYGTYYLSKAKLKQQILSAGFRIDKQEPLFYLPVPQFLYSMQKKVEFIILPLMRNIILLNRFPPANWLSVATVFLCKKVARKNSKKSF